jgi:EAL domain-containing protein (putative c-di-GMP-specific phosphodiesterase class I)
MAQRLGQSGHRHIQEYYTPQLIAQHYFRILRQAVIQNADLYEAMEREEFQLYYQPILEIRTYEIVGFEALLRWHHPTQGNISPADFIPIAEDTGLILPIGRWTFERALGELQELKKRSVVGADATVSINLSPRQFQDAELLGALDAAIQKHNVDPRSIWLEVTESIMMEDPGRARQVLDSIVSRGMRIAVDDFGTGYSSLSLLDQYPIARLKIDRAFVKELDQPNTKITLVRSMIVMAHTLGMDVVAEGCETVGQADILADLGADFIQGFLYAKPVRVEDVPHVVADVNRMRAHHFAQSITGYVGDTTPDTTTPSHTTTADSQGTYASGS